MPLSIAQLCEGVTEATGKPLSTVKTFARVLQEAGYVPKGTAGRGGVGAAQATFEHAACLLFSLTATDVATGAPGKLALFGALSPAGVLDEDETGRVQVSDVPPEWGGTLLSALACILSHENGDIVRRLRLSLSDQPRAEIWYRANGPAEPIRYGVAMYGARIASDEEARRLEAQLEFEKATGMLPAVFTETREVDVGALWLRLLRVRLRIKHDEETVEQILRGTGNLVSATLRASLGEATPEDLALLRDRGLLGRDATAEWEARTTKEERAASVGLAMAAANARRGGLPWPR